MVTPVQAQAQQVADRGWTPQRSVTQKNLGRFFRVLGQPIPNTSQELAVISPADVTFYYGTRGGGKSYCMLLHYALYLDRGYGKFYRGMVLGYEESSLTNILDISHQLFDDLPGAVYYSVEKTWEFRAGEILRFVFASDIRHYERKIHGRSNAWIGVEESTNWESTNIIMKAATTLRTGFDPAVHSPDMLAAGKRVRKEIPPLRPRLMLVANPSGEGRLWHKQRYIDVARPGEIVTRNWKVMVKGSRELVEVPRTQVAVFSSFTENPFYSPSEVAALYEQCAKDPVLQDMWIYGKWDVSAGGALDDLWRSDVHILEDFVVPKSWEVDRSHDWGSSEPSATIWWAESDGCEVEIDGQARCFPRGTLFAIEELYTSERPGHNVGTRAPPGTVAQMIINVEKAMVDRGTINERPQPGPADNTIHSVNQVGVPSIAMQMGLQGVHWTKSDRTDGARINGLQAIRQRLAVAAKNEEPGVFFCRRCKNTILLVPPIRRDEKRIEDVNKRSEDHLYDAVRYRILAAKKYTVRVQPLDF